MKYDEKYMALQICSRLENLRGSTQDASDVGMMLTDEESERGIWDDNDPEQTIYENWDLFWKLGKHCLAVYGQDFNINPILKPEVFICFVMIELLEAGWMTTCNRMGVRCDDSIVIDDDFISRFSETIGTITIEEMLGGIRQLPPTEGGSL